MVAARWPDCPSRWALLLLVALAFALRLWRLEAAPPGLRDDELINVLVISQKVLDGQWAVFYPDASGHEALYHVLNAATVATVGRNTLGIRLLSIILGVLAVPLTYQVGRRLFDRRVGLVAAAGLAFSFWSLMYSRMALRHIGLPPFALLAFYFFWGTLRRGDRRSAWLAGLFLGLSLYVYFAARGMPLILLALGALLFLFDRPLFRARWRAFALLFTLAALLSLPLVWTLRQLPAADARVAELALPLTEARAGNFAPLWQHVTTTLNMVQGDGDPEWLYNIPGRPLFGPLGALAFWLGVAIALKRAIVPPFNRSHAFLLLWWFAGISPAFLSVPPASLSHTILAQPATYLLAALPVGWLGGPGLRRLPSRWRRAVAWLAALLLLASIAGRDVPAYFRDWANSGNVRFLYHAGMRQVAQAGARQPALADFGITGLLDGPWSRLALQIALQEEGAQAQPRWFNPQRAILLATGGQPALNFHGYPLVEDVYDALYTAPPLLVAGGYRLGQATAPPLIPFPQPVCFENGLCALDAGFDAASGRLEVTWEVARPLELPPLPLVSNPPPPGVYAGPRLLVFAQWLDDAGAFLAGDDALGVDPLTLRPGDRFRQQHFLQPPPGSPPGSLIFGLYDPLTGARWPTDAGQDHATLPQGVLP